MVNLVVISLLLVGTTLGIRLNRDVYDDLFEIKNAVTTEEPYEVVRISFVIF